MAAHENRTSPRSLHLSTRPQHTSECRRVSAGLLFPRVFSSSEIASVDSVRWERRDLSRELTEVEVPAEWSTSAALHFLRRHERKESLEGEAGGVRAVVDRLLRELRADSLEAGYFACVEDAALFAEEIGALLLSSRAALEWPRSSAHLQGDASPAGVGHWDAARSVPEKEHGPRLPRDGDDATCRILALDDPDLAAVLAGREDAASQKTRLVLVLPDALLSAVKRSAEGAPGDDGEAQQSGAGDLLTCIAEAVLRRGKLDLLFQETAWRTEAFSSQEANELEEALAGAATIDLRKMRTEEGLLDLDRVRAATALLVTALEVGADRQTYAGGTAAIRVQTERRLSIGLANVDDVLRAGGVDLQSDEARCISACMAALVSGEAVWQSARLAERCSVLSVAVSQDRSPRADDPVSAAATRHYDGGSTAFQSHANEVLEWLRMQRAAAYRVGDAMSDGEEPTRLYAGLARAPLVQQLPEILAVVRHVWDGVLYHAERFGVRHLGVTGAGEHFFSARTAEEMTEHRVAAPEFPLSTQIRLMATAQPFVHALTPWRMVSSETLSREQLRTVVLEAWRCGLKGISMELPRTGETMQTADMYRESEGTVEERTQSGPGGPGLKESEAAGPRIAQADVETLGEEKAYAVATQVDADTVISATTHLRTMTLADAEQAAMDRGHATLVETQLDRISELEEQLKEVQAKARESGEAYDAKEPPRAMRHRLPAERASVTHKFVIAGHEGYITVGLYPNGSPGEIFLRMTKEGSAVAGLLDSFATAVSLALQYGVPVRLLAQQFGETRFEPSGTTENEQIPYALSIMDYLFRWIELRFLSGHQMDLFANLSPTPTLTTPMTGAIRVTGTVSGPKSSVVPNVSGVRSTGIRS